MTSPLHSKYPPWQCYYPMTAAPCPQLCLCPGSSSGVAMQCQIANATIINCNANEAKDKFNNWIPSFPSVPQLGSPMAMAKIAIIIGPRCWRTEDGPEWVQRSRPIKFDDKVIGEIGWGGSRWRTGQRRLELQENIWYQWQFGSLSYVINSQAQKHKPYIPS